MTFEEYWIGKGVDFDELWSIYDQGQGYIEKYRSMEVYLLQLTFEQYGNNLPLFNLEAVLKTSKGVFHNLKKNYLSPEEYDKAGPLFVYDIQRGSEIWRFLGELKPLILFGVSIWNQIRKGTVQVKAEKISLIEGLQRRFPNSNISEIIQYIDSLPGHDEARALERLYGQNLKSVEISEKPFLGDIKQTQIGMISFGEGGSDVEKNN
jgi:hypothetical protein